MIANEISLNPFKIALVLGAVAFFLVLASIAGQLMFYMTGNKLYGLVLLFDIDAEYNIPTFFSMLLLLFAALLLAVITILERRRTASHVFHWAILSFGFLIMAVDEIVCIHERLVNPLRRLLGTGNLGVFNFAWVIPGICTCTRPRTILSEILDASSCENKAHFFDGCCHLHRGLHRFRTYRGPLCRIDTGYTI